LPSAGVGGLLALYLGGPDLSVIGIIGIILLIGIVNENGIKLADFAIAAERDERLARVNAIRQACFLRCRPIMMTTAATLLAGLPLMLGTGTAPEMRQPWGYSSGLASSIAVGARISRRHDGETPHHGASLLRGVSARSLTCD